MEAITPGQGVEVIRSRAPEVSFKLSIDGTITLSDDEGYGHFGQDQSSPHGAYSDQQWGPGIAASLVPGDPPDGE